VMLLDLIMVSFTIPRAQIIFPAMMKSKEWMQCSISKFLVCFNGGGSFSKLACVGYLFSEIVLLFSSSSYWFSSNDVWNRAATQHRDPNPSSCDKMLDQILPTDLTPVAEFQLNSPEYPSNRVKGEVGSAILDQSA
jgi:hypothetical protein